MTFALLPTSFADASQYPPNAPAPWNGTPTTRLIRATVSGIATAVVPPAVPDVRIGSLQPLFGADFFDRIHITPLTLALGNVISTQDRELWVWNAFRSRAVTLTAMPVSGTEGMTIRAPAPLPLAFPPMTERVWGVSISTSGPPTIAATITYQFDGFDDITVTITGSRVVVFPFRPNWSSPFNETLSFLTAVERAFDGSEQRTPLRDRPRRIFEYSLAVLDGEHAYFESLLFCWQDRLYAVPIWPERSNLTAAADAGALSIVCDTADRTLVEGGLLLLYRNTRTFEAAFITGIAGDVVSVQTPLTRAWPAGTRVYPLQLAMLNEQTQLQYATDRYLTAAVRFTADPVTSDPRLPALPAPETDQGIELVRTHTNWRDGMTVGYTADAHLHDNNTGAFQLRPRSGLPQVTRQHTWFLKGRPAISAFRAFLGRRQGRAASLWMPTGTDDLVLVADIAAGAQALQVRDNGYHQFASHHPARSRVLLELRDGTWRALTITGTADLGDGITQLTITPAIPTAIVRAAVRRLSYLGRYRLNSDDITLTWHSGVVAEAITELALVKD